MVSHEQAVHYLEEIIQMSPSWRHLLSNDPLEFLTIFLRRHATRVPFQSIEMSAKDPKERWFPSEEEYIAQGMTGRGGCCIHLNYFNMMVLRTIGMDTFVVRGDHYQAPIPGNHCILMVRLHGPKDFGLYMIETGGYFPFLDPIPMDKEKLPFRILQAAGFPCEYKEFAPGWIGKFHIGGGIMGGKYTDKDEILRTSWDRRPRALWEFDYPMLETFTNPAVSGIIKFPAMYRYFTNSEFRRLFPELHENISANKNAILTTRQKPKKLINGDKTNTVNDEDDEPEVYTDEDEQSDLDNPKNFIYVWKRRIVIGDANKRKIVKNYDNWDEMGDDLKKYFPMIPSEAVDKAMKNYSRFEVKTSPYDSIL